MKTIVPNYYDKFLCTASECKHSCCKGWEIDIDAQTHDFYKTLDGEIGERLKRSISTDETPQFVLGEDERCPFLNEKGLCDIIISCGEDALCDICADHPRFRNFFSDRTELGLGLCCEAAAKLILGFDEPFCLEVIEDDGEDEQAYEDENEVKAAFEKAIAVAQDKSLAFADRCEKLTETFGVSLPDYSTCEWAQFYRSLERLDSEWDNCLKYLESCKELASNYHKEQTAENLLCYFLFRHMAAALDDGDIPSKVGYAVLSCRVVMTLAETFGIEEAARFYSSEIEYSDENLDKIFSVFDR